METQLFSYRIIRTSRKTMAIQIQGGEVTVRCPKWMSDERIRSFVSEKSGWIQKHLAGVQNIPDGEPITQGELEAWTRQAKLLLPERVDVYAKMIGVDYGKITVRHQHSRWGSCSTKGNLSFNCLLMQVPLEVLDYVVVHELCHRKEMNHSQRFWAEVERAMPDYRIHKKWLKDHAPELIGRLPKK